MTLIEFLKSLLAKGFATAEEKTAVNMLLKTAPDEEKEGAEELAEEVDTLPEAPEGDEGEGESEGSDEGDDEGDAELAKSVKDIVEKAAKDAVSNAKEAGEKAVAKFIKEQKTAKAKRAGAYHVDAKTKRATKNEFFRKFFTAVAQNDVFALKDLNIGTPASGGYLVDSELRAEIEHLTTEYGVARREFTVLTVSKNSIDLNNLATDVSVAWTDEMIAKTSTGFEIGRGTLNLKKIAAIVPMSDELLEDSEIDLVSFITGRVAEKMAEAEDEQFLAGSGSPFVGILLDPTVNVATMAQASILTLDADDLIDMQDATPSGAHANGKYYMHRSILSLVRKLKDTTGQYIYQSPQGNLPATIWDKPVVLSEVMPDKNDNAGDTPFVIFGDLRKAAVMGLKGDLRVAQSNQATVKASDNITDVNLFQQDMTALRFVRRVGYVLIVPSAVTVLKTAVGSI